MKFQLRVDENMKEDLIDVVCNKRNYKALEGILKKMEQMDACFELFDDEHNMFRIHIMQIYYVEIIDNKVYAYTSAATYRIYRSFSSLKKTCKSIGLKQINKNTLVNISHIQAIKIASECRRILYLDNQEQLIVNRQFRDFLNS